MKIGVVGNCWAPAIGFSLMQLLENDTVYGFAASVWQQNGKLSEVIDLLKSCDIVFSHKLPEAYGVLEWSQFASVHSCVYALPPTLFTGFHPDCIYIPAAGGQFVGSAIGPYSSAIAAAVYSLGGDVQTAVRLFNSNTFERLGYFAEFEKAKGFMFNTFAQFGLDVAPEWEGWMREAPFMHTINHPRPIVLGSVAKQIAEKVGLISPKILPPVPILDTLAPSAIWPVYPEIGAALGIHGDYLFKKVGAPLDISDGEGPFLRLKPFIEQSFGLYDKHDKRAFEVPAVTRAAAVIKELI